MTIKEYSELINTTCKYDVISHTHNSVSIWVKEIIDISSFMKYEKELRTISKFLDKYSTVKVGRLGENKKIKYLQISAPLEARENIKNLMFHVQNQQECDISEKILCF